MSCPYLNKKTKSNEDNCLTYGKYLELEGLLNSQVCQSQLITGQIVHDEMLFIITHQTFELWFKQILFELKSIKEKFQVGKIEERNMLTIVSRLNRIIQIMKLINSQFSVLETMSARQFYDFREFLQQSSGFQSLQFRLIEIMFGVDEEKRILVKGHHYSSSFPTKDRELMSKALKQKSLFDLVDEWLQRTPGVEVQEFNFFEKFKIAVYEMLEKMRIEAEKNKDYKVRESLIKEQHDVYKSFEKIFDEDEYEKAIFKKDKRLSYKAMQGALMILIYNEEPRFHIPYQIIQHLIELDSQFTKFRFSHTCMVQKMIGSGVGTHGSSGYHYLRATCSNRYQIFDDFTKLNSYLIPKEMVPALPKVFEQNLLTHDYEFCKLEPIMTKLTASLGI